MGPNMFVEVSNKKMLNIKIECQVLDKFCFPFINSFFWFNHKEGILQTTGGGSYLFSITSDNKKLVFHSDWTHEFTSEGVLIDISGSGNKYLVNFGFIND